MLISLYGGNILRIKGMLNVAGAEEPIVIHGVQHVFHPPVRLEAWPNDDRSSKIVFIVRDLKPEMFEHTLKAYNEESAAPPAHACALDPAQERGRESGRDRVCQDVLMLGGAVYLKKDNKRGQSKITI